jgi:peptide-methionine (S)-S-oxide reductase
MKLATTMIAAAFVAAPATAAPRTETAVLAGGCFWGMETVFEHVKGVTDVVSGYANRAEAVKISYDPAQISYPQLLQIYFTVAHDPTQVNRQGPDEGTSYRSAIFPQSPQQAQIARALIARLNGAHVYKQPIATKLESSGFYPAPAFHQDFARKHPFYPYIVINDRPKVAALKAKYPSLFKA